MKSLVLIGFMGSGKSAVGKTLADKLGWDFIDTDDLVEEAEGRRVSEIFADDGEIAFRKLETEAIYQAISQTLSSKRAVISLGGGALTQQQNWDILQVNEACVVWLRATPQVILDRIGHQKHRPLLAGLEPEAMLEKIETMLQTRHASYARADVEIDTDRLGDVAEVVSAIVATLSDRGITLKD